MGVSKEPGREISKVLMDHVLISCTINITYEIAKQISVRATRAVKWGKITSMLWPRGSGFWKREDRSSSIGPIRTTERVVFLMGSIIV